MIHNKYWTILVLLHIIIKTFFEPVILDTQFGLENFLYFISNAPDD